jgi:copper transport protein
MTELGTWRAALLSSYGPGWLAGEATLAVAAVALLFRGQRAAAGLSTVALIGVGVTLSVSGHANDTALLSLNRTAVFFHGMGAAAWAGALVPLAALFIRRDPSAGIALKRFSAAIPFFVIPLVAAGVFLAASQLTSWDDLWTTAYGSILSAKLVAVAVLLALAAFNRYRLTWPAVAGSKKATSALVLLTRVEWALVVVILALVAEWRLTPPPTALLAAAASLPVPGYVVMASADGTIFADVGFTPGRVGPNDVVIEVTDNEGEPINVSEVSLALSLPSAEITSTTRTAVLSRDNVWKIPGLVLPAAGTWKITLDVLKSDFADTKIDAEVAITR